MEIRAINFDVTKKNISPSFKATLDPSLARKLTDYSKELNSNARSELFEALSKIKKVAKDIVVFFRKDGTYYSESSEYDEPLYWGGRRTEVSLPNRAIFLARYGEEPIPVKRRFEGDSYEARFKKNAKNSPLEWIYSEIVEGRLYNMLKKIEETGQMPSRVATKNIEIDRPDLFDKYSFGVPYEEDKNFEAQFTWK